MHSKAFKEMIIVNISLIYLTTFCQTSTEAAIGCEWQNLANSIFNNIETEIRHLQ